ncbi:MAG: phosphomannomutase/phosphoglucomutase [marine benthic group bacterium]|jgi:phosphomannomutase/phosphoglucomutase|nr:phosphomannomutase/phosphoglucomutase [Candidatus Benthicola marisminoris]
MNVSNTIFREYDIRGIVDDDLTVDVASAVGRAYATRLRRTVDKPIVVVGQDNRPSSPDLAEALAAGLNASGADARLVGTVPTPALYYAAHVLEADGGIQITGSHNPPEYNGIKMIVGDRALYGSAIQELRELVQSDSYAEGSGRTDRLQILDRYADEIGRRAKVEGPVRMVLDCGNGTGSVIAPQALEAAGIDVDCLYCESDGTFPNHHPDPTVDANVVDLIRRVRETGSQLGVGLDGDADRIGAVTETGAIVRGDHLLLLYALDALPRYPGAEIVFDVKCSQALPEMIARAGGVPVMWKTGHSLIKERMKESGSPIAGEMSGHICFADNYFGFDDAIFAAARLAGLVQRSGKNFSELAEAIPAYPSTPELRVDCPEDRKFAVVERAVEHYRALHPVNDIDGARVEFEDGWALIRASNTQPVIVARFEADSVEGLVRIRDDVAEYLGREGVTVPEIAGV